MRSRLLGILGLAFIALVCATPSFAQEKGDRDITPNAPGTIHGATPVPETLSTLWLALPAVGMFALARRHRKKV